MQVKLTKEFKKYFKKRIQPNESLKNKYKDRLSLFVRNRKDPILKDHKLTGKMKDYRAYSVTGDIRVVYFEESRTLAVFVDIGSHNQVY